MLRIESQRRFASTFNSTLVLLIILSIPGANVSCRKESPTGFQTFYQSQLFSEVQQSDLFSDSKTFVDCLPLRSLDEILDTYDKSRGTDSFNLGDFVHANFDLPERPASFFTSDTTLSMEEHIDRVWPVLTRTPDEALERDSRIPLPHPYIVPGGRFTEIYYWDSYFTMLGLAAEGNYTMINNMVSNFAFLIDSIGHIPNGNRAYYASRSQPPFFSMMVNLLERNDSTAILYFLPELEKEYAFWMEGAGTLHHKGDVHRRVVMVGDGIVMNRYWDDLATPRPEAFKEDVAVQKESGREAEMVYRNLRAAAESGWDFCTRWLADGTSLETIHTTDFIPVDLNALMYNLEITLGRAYAKAGRREESEHMVSAARSRKESIDRFCWDPERSFYLDYDFVKSGASDALSVAGMYPFFVGMADTIHSGPAAEVIRSHFLKPGGIVSTLKETGQQWDAPNGWAPLEWVTWAGLMRYGQKNLASAIRSRWLRLNRKVFRSTGRMEEKYNVMDTTLRAGGGEYPNQDGFGWTNGVALALLHAEAVAEH